MSTATLEAVRLAARIGRIEPSATMAAVAEAEKLRQQGIDVVDCTAGEPHFSTPQHIKDAAIAAINVGRAHDSFCAPNACVAGILVSKEGQFGALTSSANVASLAAKLWSVKT